MDEGQPQWGSALPSVCETQGPCTSPFFAAAVVSEPSSDDDNDCVRPGGGNGGPSASFSSESRSNFGRLGSGSEWMSPATIEVVECFPYAIASGATAGEIGDGEELRLPDTVAEPEDGGGSHGGSSAAVAAGINSAAEECAGVGTESPFPVDGRQRGVGEPRGLFVVDSVMANGDDDSMTGISGE
eukprot:GHVU01170837.1.p1 GENE.GHVU01170837.1~~GHVU01170837.1.p1  ORF type:complete len:185 (+),score=20.05 GHVU01170837.1:3106-3660(+)